MVIDGDMEAGGVQHLYFLQRTKLAVTITFLKLKTSASISMKILGDNR